MRPPYRGDIDGLRAVAVLFVVAFHAFPRKVPGGFTGVDIFFVISGFLITSLILRSKENGDFSFMDFYARRIKRIFPALIVMIAACLAVGWIVMFPGEYRDLGKHAPRAPASLRTSRSCRKPATSTITADHKPLLHLWSLGIEEQFYIVWPALIVLVWRWRNGPLAMAALICLGSFVWNVMLTKTNPSQAFFLPFTRFWELMIGCIVAFATAQNTFAELSPPGLTALYERHRQKIHEHGRLARSRPHHCGGGDCSSRTRAFPGWWALLPTLGAALIILAGPQSTINRWVLSHRTMIYIGLISYPLYLWHWPILSYARLLHFKEPTDLVKGLCIVLAFVLAHLTYRYIERPIRFGTPTPRKPIMASAALTAAGCLGLLIYAGSGIPSRFPKELQNVVADFRNNPAEDARQYRCLYKGRGQVSFAAVCDGIGPAGNEARACCGAIHTRRISGPGSKSSAAER